jgi:hypothetical protein
VLINQQLLIDSTMASVAMDTGNDLDMSMQSHPDISNAESMKLSSAATTIDPTSQQQSRILQSDSVQRLQKDDDELPHFSKISAIKASGDKVEYRRVRCPPHRYTPLREHWEQILTPLVEYLKLQVSLSLYMYVVWFSYWRKRA